MHLYLLNCDEPFAQQEFNVAVVARARDEPTITQMIDATVADVRPPSRALLHEAHRASRTRALLKRQMAAEPDDLFMSPAERQVQKPEWIEQGLRRVPEALK